MILFTAVFCFFSLILPLSASAQTETTTTASDATIQAATSSAVETASSTGGASTNITVAPKTSVRLIVFKIIGIALILLAVALLAYTAYGGYLWRAAAGDEFRIEQARKIVTYGAVGLGIVLFAYLIVFFVTRALSRPSIPPGPDSPDNGGPDSSFIWGAGGLGSVIKDHYPQRGQKDVPRNTKIIITFKKSVLPDSIIADTNSNGIIGDCTNIGSSMSWEKDCDQLKSGAIKITLKEKGEAVPAAALISYENGKANTVVLRPLQYLGNETTSTIYAVRIGKDVLLDDSANNNPSIFAGRQTGKDHYEWNFTCGTFLDLTPPYVVNVFPMPQTTEAKNSVIQIHFSKPMDPTGLQGSFTSSSESYFVLSGNTVFLKTGHAIVPPGSFKLLNNYQTLEFTPSTACGFNSCGSAIYCLPVCDPAQRCSSDEYEILVRAGQTFTSKNFEAIPFTGAVDTSGNALDGNDDGKVNTASRTGAVFPNQVQPDNYGWKFTISDSIDSSGPHIVQTHPGPDATYVAADEEISLVFSKRMRVDPLYNIDIQEQPAQPEPICKVPRYSQRGDGTSKVSLIHCLFDVVNQHYYFPVVDSEVQDVHFNCFYPGKGPVGLNPSTKSSVICDDDHPENCCGVGDEQNSAFCCNGLTNYNSRQACLNNLRAISR